ncbi:hypothetical protein SMA75_20360 [Escherichia coli]|uniref:hypothetical protein n=1 Tax=Escherichia coli TaxID=562 RepID=UPI0030794E98
MMRNFRIVAHVGEENRERHEEIIGAESVHTAAWLFAYKRKGIVYAVRTERTGPEGKGVWSAGWSESGLRMWIYEE